jgi:hypothetical protein
VPTRQNAPNKPSRPTADFTRSDCHACSDVIRTPSRRPCQVDLAHPRQARWNWEAGCVGVVQPHRRRQDQPPIGAQTPEPEILTPSRCRIEPSPQRRSWQRPVAENTDAPIPSDKVIEPARFTSTARRPCESDHEIDGRRSRVRREALCQVLHEVSVGVDRAAAASSRPCGRAALGSRSTRPAPLV